jgi:hypothetical protein
LFKGLGPLGAGGAVKFATAGGEIEIGRPASDPIPLGYLRHLLDLHLARDHLLVDQLHQRWIAECALFQTPAGWAVAAAEMKENRLACRGRFPLGCFQRRTPIDLIGPGDWTAQQAGDCQPTSAKNTTWHTSDPSHWKANYSPKALHPQSEDRQTMLGI